MAKTKKRKLFMKGEYFDYTTVFVILVLVCFGLVMIYSTSSYSAYIKFGDAAYFLKRQGTFALLGLACMFFVSRIDYHNYKKLTLIGYVVSVGLLLFVFLFGSEKLGAKRWIEIGPIQFQPSEIAKIVMIIFVAHMVSNCAAEIKKWKILLKVLFISAIVVGLIAMENLSTAIVTLAIVIVILFVASPKYGQFIGMGMIAAAGMGLFLALFPYRIERVKIWLAPEKYEKGFQTLQSLYAIGSGGIFGKGLGQSMQKMGFIPESHNDMIFSVICEELGLFGAICVIILFLVLIWRLMIIAANAKDLFGSLIVVGVMAHIATQVLVNIAVVTNTIPPTGVTLPFISYGGTSLVFLLIEMGIVLGVSRQIKLEQHP